MRTLLCAMTILITLLASVMFWMAELVSRGLIVSSVSSTRYAVVGVIFAIVAVGALRGAVENQ